MVQAQGNREYLEEQLKNSLECIKKMKSDIENIKNDAKVVSI